MLVITKGMCTVRTANETITAQASEIIYLPTSTPGILQADEDAELVYVASSPYGEGNKGDESYYAQLKGLIVEAAGQLTEGLCG